MSSEFTVEVARKILESNQDFDAKHFDASPGEFMLDGFFTLLHLEAILVLARDRVARMPSVHPVDALKNYAALEGWPAISAEREAQLRSICDEEVCAACGRSLPIAAAPQQRVK